VHNDLPTDTAEITLAQATECDPRPISEERAKATVQDLRDRGSDTILWLDRVKKMGVVAAVLGTGGAGKEAATAESDPGVVIDPGTIAEQLTAWQSLITQASTTFQALFGNMNFLLLAGAGVGIYFLAKKVTDSRINDHRRGLNMGR